MKLTFSYPFSSWPSSFWPSRRDEFRSLIKKIIGLDFKRFRKDFISLKKMVKFSFFFSQHFLFVGLLFCIPEQDERQIGNSEFSAPSGRRNLEVVIEVIIVVVAPLPFFPTTLYVCGSPFLHPWASTRQTGNSEFSAPSGGRNLDIVIVIIVAPLPWPPPHEIQKISKIDQFLKGNLSQFFFVLTPTRFKVH